LWSGGIDPHSKARLKSSGEKASFCLSPLGTGKAAYECLSINSFLDIICFNILIYLTRFFGIFQIQLK
jgi:hypothetical protein